MNRKILNIFAVSCSLIFCVSLNGNAVSIDFEDEESYDNETQSQTFGKFRNLEKNATINRVYNNANYVLQFKGPNKAAVVYDVTPSEPQIGTTFSVGVGETLSVTLDCEPVNGGPVPDGKAQREAVLRVGFFNPDASEGNPGIVSSLTMDFFTDIEPSTRFFLLTDVANPGYELTAANLEPTSDTDALAYTIQVDYTRISEDIGQITFTVYTKDELGSDNHTGDEISFRSLNFTYGSGPKNVNMETDKVGIFIGTLLSTSVSLDIDNFTAKIVP